MRGAWQTAVLVVGLAAAGCGPQMLQTKGRVLQGGAPLRPGPEEIVRVTFVPLPADGQPARDYYVAAYDPDAGTFRVVGKDGRGMPPGKYRVAVELERRRKDQFKGAFDANRSPFVFDVDSGTPEIVIDLDKPPGK